MKYLNVNAKVKVRLNEIGRRIWLENQLNNNHDVAGSLSILLPRVDSEGYTEMRIIDLMSMFSNFVYLGEDVNLPFDQKLILVEDSTVTI